MAIILDADVVIRGEKGKFDLPGWLAAFPEERFEVAAVTIAELWHGVERARGAQRSTREEYLKTVRDSVRILPYTEQTAYEHARIWAALEATGSMIGDYDLIVAATALEHGSQLATFNVRHFARIKGLSVVKPS